MNIDKNRFATTYLKVAKVNIMKNKEVNNNPIFISGLTYKERYNLYFRLFNKDFNKNHKGQLINCTKIEKKIELKTNCLLIIENIDSLSNNLLIQEKILDLINKCLNKKIQIIIGSNFDEAELKLESKLQNRLNWGILLKLE